MTKIRLAKREDAIAIAMLGRTTFSEAFGHLFSDKEGLRVYLNKTFSVEKIETSLEKQNNVYWIALVDRLPVGYAKLKLRSSCEFIEEVRISQLQKIYVLQDFLSMKIGKQLQNVLLERASKSGSRKIWLSVYKGNERAISFYKKNNFEEVGRHQFNIGHDTFAFLAMSKHLGHS